MIERFIMVLFTLVIFAIPAFRRALFPAHGGTPYTKPERREPFADIAKGIAIIGVIIIHIGYVFFAQRGTANDIILLNTINNLLRFALPIFFILSGAFLYLPSYRVKDVYTFYIKKISRIFIPFLFCTAIVADVAGLSLKEFALLLVRGDAQVPYYFIIILFQLYILYPVLLPLRKSRAALVLTFFISLGSFFFLPISIAGIPIGLRFLFFFFYGLYMRDYFLSSNKQETKAWGGIVLLYAYFAIVSLFLNPIAAHFFNVRLFFGIAMLHLLWRYRECIMKEELLARILQSFGRKSLWIYLLHFGVISALYHVGVHLGLSYYVLYLTVLISSLLISYGVGSIADVMYRRVQRMCTLPYVEKK